MLLGPVFRAELVRTARRRRYYVLRFLYGAALLFLVSVSYISLADLATLRGGKPLISDVARFAFETFVQFALLQLVTIVALVPLLFGGVIADEKQRKTLHYLMASRLTSSEIVLDKLLARLLHVGVFLLIGLPVMSLISLFGGVAWEYVAVAYSGTCSVTFFTAALATLMSTLCRRVLQAVLFTYLLVIGWLILPIAGDLFYRFVFPSTYAWFAFLNEWFLASDPLILIFNPVRRIPAGRGAFRAPFLMMLQLQAAAGVLFLSLAVWQLRRTYRRQEGGSRRLTWFRPGRQRPRWLSRPDCGEDAMLWKERHFVRTDVVTKLVVLPATILLTVGLVLFGDYDELVVRTAQDLRHLGYTGHSVAQGLLHDRLRSITPIYLGLWLLAVAGASASSLTVERDDDSWVSLVSTPLTGWEILRGKMVGAIWGLRGFGALLSLFWLLGLVLGAVHPLGLLLSLLIAGLLTVSVAALGVYVSLGARTTSQALMKALTTLIILNGGYLVVLVPVLKAFRIEADELHFIGCTPWLASFALLSFEHVTGLREGTFPWRFLIGPGMVVGAYVMAALVLLYRALATFDERVDRPRRPDTPHRDPDRPPVSRPVAEAADRPVR